MSDVNVVNAASLVTVRDAGGPRRGSDQNDMHVIADGAVAIRDGRIVAVGATADVIEKWGGGVPTIDAAGQTVLPGLVECHSHPIFAGERCHEYAERLAGATLAEVAQRGGGIWSSVRATREATDDVLSARLARTYRQILAGGATTLEVKSGYGLTTAHELRHLQLLAESRSSTPMQLVITFLGAHIVPQDLSATDRADAYTDLIEREMLPAVVEQGLAQFQDITVEAGLFTPEQALRLIAASLVAGLPVRVHADAWAPSRGWVTAVQGGAVSAEHLTYTADEEIDEVGASDTIAVLLPIAELVYMTDRRANARRFIETGVPVALATDHCSSIHATSSLHTLAVAAPWYRITPAEAVVGATLNAAYALGLGAECGSLDVGKRGDLLVLDCPHPDELFLAVSAPLLRTVVIGGSVVTP